MIAIYISSMIHDFKHFGLNNGFLINNNHELATQYNDISVLESYHVSEAFKIIRSDPKYDILSKFTKDEKKALRKKMIDCVLSTDMTSHARYYTWIKLKVETYDIKEGKNAEKLFTNITESLNQIQQDFCSLVVHFSDIANPTKPFTVYKNWMETVMEEFFRQGDLEKKMGVPVSFLCDRETTGLEGSQIGFIDGIIIPFALPIVEIFPTLSFFTNNLNQNKGILKMMKETNEKKAKELKEAKESKESKDIK